MAECGLDDGLEDGIISNPPACGFDPSSLLCKPGEQSGCLTPEQIDAAKKIYAGPTDSSGRQIYMDGAVPGSELDWSGYHEFGSTFSRDFFRFLAFVPDAGPDWEPEDFDFDRDYQRFGVMEGLFGGTDPDLRRFKANGGKLMLYHGWSDAGGGGISPMKTIDYYETLEKTMGGREATREFLRFFMIPGMGHCHGGTGANEFDYLTYLEDWVERDIPPDVMTGAHVDLKQFYEAHAEDRDYSGIHEFLADPANRQFTRPVYLYPAYAKYKGIGDPKDAENFEPAEP
jgi:feruloyl esterase